MPWTLSNFPPCGASRMVFRRPPVTRRSLAQNSLLAFATAAFVTSTPLTLALAQPAAGLATPEASAAHESAFAIPADDARDREVYRQHLMLLSDPFMEGRGPGTRATASPPIISRSTSSVWV